MSKGLDVVVLRLDFVDASLVEQECGVGDFQLGRQTIGEPDLRQLLGPFRQGNCLAPRFDLGSGHSVLGQRGGQFEFEGLSELVFLYVSLTQERLRFTDLAAGPKAVEGIPTGGE